MQVFWSPLDRKSSAAHLPRSYGAAVQTSIEQRRVSQMICVKRCQRDLARVEIKKKSWENYMQYNNVV